MDTDTPIVMSFQIDFQPKGVVDKADYMDLAIIVYRILRQKITPFLFPEYEIVASPNREWLYIVRTEKVDIRPSWTSNVYIRTNPPRIHGFTHFHANLNGYETRTLLYAILTDLYRVISNLQQFSFKGLTALIKVGTGVNITKCQIKEDKFYVNSIPIANLR